MPLVEVARTPASSDTALATLTQWAIDLGKTPVLVRDSPGFVVNRILMPYLNEAVMLVAEGVAVEQIDRVMKRFGMPMGPLELLDQIGLDMAAHVAQSMEPVLAGRFEPNTAFEKMCAAGLSGPEERHGFYLHGGKKPQGQHAGTRASPRAEVPRSRGRCRRRRVRGGPRADGAADGERGGAGTEREQLAATRLRSIWRWCWAAVRAPHRGGPLHYADDRGLADMFTR